jgi:hypothetical protein
MNIIFGTELAKQAQDRYTVLELDTFDLRPTDEVITAYCLVESIPLEEMPAIDKLKDLHSNLIAEYRKRNWRYCEDAIAHLTGKWHGELNTFYTDLLNRINQHKEHGVPDNWSANLVKNIA